MSILDGRYTLEVPLGESDLGTVWAAHDTAGTKLVVITLEDDVEAAVAERFREHAKALLSMKHANVAQALATGDQESGAPYLAVERIEGPSLAKRLAEGPPVTIARVVEMATALAEALAVVHAAKIAHGDIEPANVLLAERGGKEVPKLIGFALNRASVRAAIARSSLPSIGVLAYAAPEQVRGDVIVSAMADQASLAAIVYAALSGRPPHVARDAAALATAIGSATAPSITAVKKELAPFASTLARALSSDPEKRFVDIGAFGRALKTAATLARAIAQTSVPIGPRNPIGEPLREPAPGLPRPGAGMMGRGLPAAKKPAAAPVDPKGTRPASARVTEKLESLADVLIEERPLPPRAREKEPPTEELELVSLPPSIPPEAPTASEAAEPSPPAVTAAPEPIATSAARAVGALDETEAAEPRDAGSRSVRPPPPPPPDAPMAVVAPVPRAEPAEPDPEASIVLSPSLETIAVLDEEPKKPAPPPAPPSARPAPPSSRPAPKLVTAEARPEVASIPTIPASDEGPLPGARPAWIVPVAALAAALVLGLIAWRALTPSEVPAPTPPQRTPVVDLTTAHPAPPLPTPPSIPTPPSVPTPTTEEPTAEEPVVPPSTTPPPSPPPTVVTPPPTTPTVARPRTTTTTDTPRPPTTSVRPPRPTTPPTTTTTPRTTTPRTTTPRTTTPPRTTTTPPRRPTVVSDPGF